jgi:hypothetical protein
MKEGLSHVSMKEGLSHNFSTCFTVLSVWMQSGHGLENSDTQCVIVVHVDISKERHFRNLM